MSGPIPASWMYGRRRLTRVEMAIYAFMVAALVAVFSSFVLDYMEMAERAAMETTIINVTSAINARYALLAMSGRRAEAAAWVMANPFDLAEASPPNYRRVGCITPTRGVERPCWLFDAPHAELVYLPRLYSHLEEGTVDELRFRLRPNPSGFGLLLVPTAPYRWQ